MASKRKPISTDTKLQALDEVDKKVKSKTQIAKEYSIHGKTPDNTRNKTRLLSPIIAHRLCDTYMTRRIENWDKPKYHYNEMNSA